MEFSGTPFFMSVCKVSFFLIAEPFSICSFFCKFFFKPFLLFSFVNVRLFFLYAFRIFSFKPSVLKKWRWDNPWLHLRFLCFRQERRMFLFRETYVFQGGNIRFPKGKHRKCWESLAKMCLRHKIAGVSFAIPYGKLRFPDRFVIQFPVLRDSFWFFCLREEKFQPAFPHRAGKMKASFTLRVVERHKKSSVLEQVFSEIKSLRSLRADFFRFFFPVFQEEILVCGSILPRFGRSFSLENDFSTCFSYMQLLCSSCLFTYAYMRAYVRPREIHNVGLFPSAFVSIKKCSPATVLFTAVYRKSSKNLQKSIA